MRILLTGINGQVGWELQRTLAPLGEVIAADRNRLDLADTSSIRRTVDAIAPDLIVNPAAYTAVDKAETEPELAHAINAAAPGELAQAAAACGIPLVHFSTDYVFDGRRPTPYTEADAPNPLGVYGATKLAGEQAVARAGAPHLILRTSWVYGLRGRNFLLTMQRLLRERDALAVVDDQFGAPTWSRTDRRGDGAGGRALAGSARSNCNVRDISSELRRAHQLARLHRGDPGAPGRIGRETGQPYGDPDLRLSHARGAPGQFAAGLRQTGGDLRRAAARLGNRVGPVSGTEFASGNEMTF